MRMRTLEISVGAFVLAGILGLVFLAFRVSGVVVGDTSGNYVLKAKFDDVAGLRVRSKVSLAGVTIGRVAKIGVDSETAEAIVTMEVSDDVDNLSVDTGARIQTEGFLGGRYISLVPGGEDQLLTDGDTITNTQGALVLENLIGDVITRLGSK
ncbi:MAG: outer membrane lipid asymmetry maintenance protein MlaD [Proteobacteria bacterium]|nr:outer membrane lipid asymmetry maintenance protein MlaD [Pseudomonadota bacterium]